MSTAPLSADQIQRVLPHRWPMLMLDRVLDHEPGKRAICEKKLSMSDIFFVGHFPGRAVMPGVLIVEAMAQACLIAALTAFPDPATRPLFFLGSSEARFLRAVVAGDTLRIEAQLDRVVGLLGMGSAKAFVDDVVVARAKLSFGGAEPQP